MITANETRNLKRRNFTTLEDFVKLQTTNGYTIAYAGNLTKDEQSELEAQGFLIWCTGYTYIVWAENER